MKRDELAELQGRQVVHVDHEDRSVDRIEQGNGADRSPWRGLLQAVKARVPGGRERASTTKHVALDLGLVRAHGDGDVAEALG